MPQHLRRMILAAVATTWCSSAWCIEAPKNDANKSEAAQPAAVPAVDEKVFYDTLRRSAQRRTLSNLRISDDVVLALARGEADVAVGLLANAAAKGGNEENIALVRIQH